MEMGLGLHSLCSRIALHSEEQQHDMCYRGSTHEDGSLHSHEKHIDSGLAGSSLSGGDSLIAWCAELYSVSLGYKVPIRILA